MSMPSVALSPVQEESLNFPGYFTHRPGNLMSDSITVFLSVDGSVIPMRVTESDSIASVKLRIQSYQGFFVKKQKLVLQGRELARNDSLVKDYGLADGNVLHLVVRLSDLQAITVTTVCGKVFEFHLERGRNVGYVKQQITKKGKGLIDLKDQELICDGEELEDQRLITDICKNNDAVIRLLVRKSAKVRVKPVQKDFQVPIEATNTDDKVADVVEEHQLGTLLMGCQVRERKLLKNDLLLEPLTVNSNIELPLVIKKLINSTFDGLEKGNEPIRSSEGSGGAYFMQDSSGREYISVFKPIDEEPMAVNNPRGLPLSIDGEGLKKGTRVGEGALREVAAYILDHPRQGMSHSFHDEKKGFAGVPPTVMVRCLHKGFNHPDGYEKDLKDVKVGSLQMFMKNIGSCEDMGPGAFPVDEVHKISVLDIRLANADRHAGNILVSKDEGGQIKLIPIDHGYCLPDKFEDCTFDWLYWPQARKPYSPETIDYINSLDAEKDIELLKSHGWDIPPECAQILRISTMLLKKGVKRGLTPFAIGSIMCRKTLNEESMIEQIVGEAQEVVLPGTSEVGFLETVGSIMDRHLDDLTC